jgi:hypothetical protein
MAGKPHLGCHWIFANLSRFLAFLATFSRFGLKMAALLAAGFMRLLASF